MSDREIRDAQRRAAGAKAKIELTATEAAFAAVREAKVQAWIASKDPAEREYLHAQVSTLEDVKAELIGKVNDGALATPRD